VRENTENTARLGAASCGKENAENCGVEDMIEKERAHTVPSHHHTNPI
jgi:hypothetical protein